MMRRMIWMGILAVAMMLTSGCSMLLGGEQGVTDREVQTIKPHPARDVTIVKTRDRYGHGDDATYETRYWYCKQNQTQLQCRRACGAETKCPEGTSSIRASLAPRASILQDQPSQASKPAADTSGETKADAEGSDGPAEAADQMTDSDNDSAGETSGEADSDKKKDKSKDKGGDQ